MTSVNGLGKDLRFLLGEAENAIKSNNEAIVLDYICSNLTNVVTKYAFRYIQSNFTLDWLV
jgi:hypothetical protein